MNFALVAVLLMQAPRVELTLEQVRNESRKQLDAVRALLDYERATAGVTVARSSIFPQLNLNFGAGAYYTGAQRQFSTIPVTDSKGTITGYESAAVDTPGFSRANFSLSLTASQLLYDGGRWWNRIFQAGRQQDAAKGQLLEQQLASELEAVRRFYVLLDAQYAFEVLQSAVGRTEAQLERAKGLYDAGRSPKSEVYDAMTNLANDKVAVIRQRQAIDEARLSLLQWLSREDTPVVAVVPPERTSLPPEIDATLKFARENRPLLASLQQSLKASEYAQKIAFAPFLPSLSFSASYQRMAPTVNPFFTDATKQNAVQFGGVLNWDLFNGLQHKGLYDQAKIERRRSEAALAQAIVDLQAEVRKTYASLLTEKDVLEIVSSNLRLAEEQLALEEGRYAIGKGTMLEVRNAQTKLTQTQLAVVRSRAAVAIAYASLERTVGGKLP